MRAGGLGLEAVEVGGATGVPVEAVLRHDQTDPVLAALLAAMEPPTLPVAIGVILDSLAATLTDRAAQAATTRRRPDLNTLLRQGPTWRMEA